MERKIAIALFVDLLSIKKIIIVPDEMVEEIVTVMGEDNIIVCDSNHGYTFIRVKPL
jgi:hypothetical protein